MDQQQRRPLRSFRSASRTMVRELGFLRDAWAPAGLAHAQVHALLELGEAGQLTPSELADRLRSDPAVVSRTLKRLGERGLVASSSDPSDRRRRIVQLTEAGAAVVRGVHDDADAQVAAALATLRPDERQQVFDGMAAYAKALVRARRQSTLLLREVRPDDDAAVKAVIRTVMPTFGAQGPGYALSDPEVDGMYAAYQAPRSAYFVIEDDAGRVLGGGGYAPLEGGDGHTAEVRKMYFLPELRGVGMGAKLMQRILDGARAEGFGQIYLETLAHMAAARRLYEGFGFQRLDAPLGDTGHHGCDTWYRLRFEGDPVV
jgi:putative acetyltransferase